MSLVHKVLRALEKQVLRGLGKGHGTKSIAAEIATIARLLGPGDVRLCVDIGGNVGNYTAALRAAYPAARVVTFEPSATNIARLTARFGSDPQVTLVPAAVSDRTGEAQLWADTPGSGLGSLTKRDLGFRNLSFEATETVRTLRFDDYWRETLGAARIDILKLDIEGHELDALRGAGAALDHVRAVQFEFGGTNIDTRTFFKDFWDFFTARGFSLHRITPFGPLAVTRYSERDESFTTTNYIAIAAGAGR